MAQEKQSFKSKKDEAINIGYPFLCPECAVGFDEESPFLEHLKEHQKNVGPPERFFLFEGYDGRVVPYSERHAVVYGFEGRRLNRRNFQSYLGVIETNDLSVFRKTVEEIKAMDLPKIMPMDRRKAYYNSRNSEIDPRVLQGVDL